MNLFLFGLVKTEKGAKIAPRVVPKLGYFDGQVPKLGSRVTLATLGAGLSYVYAIKPLKQSTPTLFTIHAQHL